MRLLANLGGVIGTVIGALSILVTGLAAPGNARAQGDDPLEALLFMEIPSVVTSSLVEEETFVSPSAISIITRAEIENGPCHTIPELIQYVVGMDAATKTQTDQDIIARGNLKEEDGSLLVLIDGFKVTFAAAGGMHWPTLPITLDEIDHIEVLRGAGSATYGADALTGVVNIITKTTDQRSNQITGHYGQAGAYAGNAQVVHQCSEKVGISVGVGFKQTEAKDQEETANDLLAAPNWGIKDWAEIARVSYRFDVDHGELEFLSEGGYTTDEEGYNPSPGDRTVDKSEKRSFFLINQLKLPLGKDLLTFRLGVQDTDQKNLNYANGAYEFKYDIESARAINARAQFMTLRLPGQVIILGSDIEWMSIKMNTAGSAGLYQLDEEDRLWSIFVQDQIRLHNDRLKVTLGGRYDKWCSLEGALTPRAVLNYSVLDRRLNLRAAASTSFRRPSFFENHYFVTWGDASWFKGRAVTATSADGVVREAKLLEPERMTAYELGARLFLRNLQFDLGLFHHRIEDSVVYEVLYADASELNLTLASQGEIEIQGVEVELKLPICKATAGFLNYTWQEGKNRTDDLDTIMKSVPTNKISGGIRYTGILNLDLRGRYVSEVTYNEVPGTAVSDYFTLDAAISKVINEHWWVKLSAINLLDDSHYEYPIYSEIVRKVIFSVRATL